MTVAAGSSLPREIGGEGGDAELAGVGWGGFFDVTADIFGPLSDPSGQASRGEEGKNAARAARSLLMHLSSSSNKS